MRAERVIPARNARTLNEQGFHDENDEHRVLCGESIRDEKMAEDGKHLRSAERDCWERINPRIWGALYPPSDFVGLQCSRKADVIPQDTTLSKDYLKALSRCDMVLLPYPNGTYFFRSSGIIAECAQLGIPCLVPDYPILGHQISSPVQVGEVFSDFSSLNEGIATVLERMRSDPYDFEAYCERRMS